VGPFAAEKLHKTVTFCLLSSEESVAQEQRFHATASATAVVGETGSRDPVADGAVVVLRPLTTPGSSLGARGAMDFQGKVAVVTGSTAGIGRATAIAFAKNGASVALIDINESGVRETASLIQHSGGQALPLRADVGVEK
jgi:hypothetical protein